METTQWLDTHGFGDLAKYCTEFKTVDELRAEYANLRPSTIRLKLHLHKNKIDKIDELARATKFYIELCDPKNPELKIDTVKWLIENDIKTSGKFGLKFPTLCHVRTAFAYMNYEEMVHKLIYWDCKFETMKFSEVLKGLIRFVCISDTCGMSLDDIKMPKGDVLLFAGNMSNGLNSEIKRFAKWLKTAPYEHKVVIAGNYDLPLDPKSYPQTWKRFFKKPCENSDRQELMSLLDDACHYLRPSGRVTVHGIKIYGTPYSLRHYPDLYAFDYKHNAQTAHFEEHPIAPDADIILSHGPAYHYGDKCMKGKFHAGSQILLDQIQKNYYANWTPNVIVSGHIHEDYGVHWHSDKPICFINASLMGDNGLTNKPIVFDMPMGGGPIKIIPGHIIQRNDDLIMNRSYDETLKI